MAAAGGNRLIAAMRGVFRRNRDAALDIDGEAARSLALVADNDAMIPDGCRASLSQQLAWYVVPLYVAMARHAHAIEDGDRHRLLQATADRIMADQFAVLEVGMAEHRDLLNATVGHMTPLLKLFQALFGLAASEARLRDGATLADELIGALDDEALGLRTAFGIAEDEEHEPFCRALAAFFAICLDDVVASPSH